MIHSGISSKNKTRSAHGVAICLNKQATLAWKNMGSIWEPISERILTIRLQSDPINTTLIAVYSPINPNNQKTATAASDDFYNDLQSTVDKVPPNDILLIIGDFNARVGKQQHHTNSKIVGPHTVDDINENGQRLMDFCITNNLVITNTIFQHKPVHQKTWMHPGNKRWHMLDYTLVNQKFRSSIEDVRVHRTAAGAIGTDHHLLCTKIKFHLKVRNKKDTQKRMYIDRKKLKDPECISIFQNEITNKTTMAEHQPTTINDKYTNFVDYINNASVKVFSHDNNNKKKRKEWLTDEIIEIVDKKAMAFLDWQNHRGTPSESRYQSKYRLLRSKAKKMIKRRQLDYWDEVSAEVETAMKQHDPATAYAIVRQLRGKRASAENIQIHDKQGAALPNTEKRLERWKEYFNQLLNVPSSVDPNIINQIQAADISPTEQLQQDKLPSVQEVQLAINQMKNGKAPGMDNISADVLKAGGLPLATWLHEIYSDIWQNETMIDSWTTAVLIPLYKNKGDKHICDNYRGISLLVVAGKVFSRIILNRVQQLLDKQLLDEQAGFRTNRSTIDQIFILKTIIEKSRDYNKPLHMCFIDIQKAYDSVNRDLLWQICKHYGLTDKITRLIQLLYKNTKACVKVNDNISDSFNIESGVLQGGITSCILFNILFDFIMRRVMEKTSTMGVNGIKLAYGNNDFLRTNRDNYVDFQILTLMYADDLVTMCDNIRDLEIFIAAFEETTQELGLTMSIKKTRIMSLKQLQQDNNRKIIKNQEVAPPNIQINIRNETISIADQFTYLGHHVTRDNNLEKEIETRLSKAAIAFNTLRRVIWYRKTISIKSKLCFFRACVLPILLYGSEVWSTTVKQERRLNTFYLKCLRTVIGVRIQDRMPNDYLLEITGQPHLNEILRRNRLRWFGHVNRMTDVHGDAHDVKKVMFSYFPNCKRPRNAGVQKRWENKILDDLNQYHIRNWRRETLNRNLWRKNINEHVQIKPPTQDIKVIVQQFKRRTQNRNMNINKTTSRKITDIIARNKNNNYNCPKCDKSFKPQGITNHVRSCATDWCQQNGIGTRQPL